MAVQFMFKEKHWLSFEFGGKFGKYVICLFQEGGGGKKAWLGSNHCAIIFDEAASKFH